MGFFDGKEYDYTTVGEFVGEKEKLELFASGTPILVKGVALNRPSQYGLQDFVSTTIEGEDRALPFSSESVPTRHQMLKDLKDYIEANPEEEVYVVLAREGRAWKLVEPTQ